MLRISSLVLCLALFSCGDDDASVDAGADAGSVDSGATDSGSTDSGNTDAGGDDAGEDDAGGDDAAADAGGDDAAADAGGDDAAADAGGDDAGNDAGADAGRTIFEGPCARTFGTCTLDTDCMPSGCGSETCASEEILSTCDCTMPAATCGCVGGSCTWFN